MFVGIAIGVAALAAVIGLISFISRRSEKLTALWSVALVLSLAITSFMFNLASVYYTMPVGWIVALGASAAAMAALFVMVGKSVGWKAPKVVAVVGLLLASMVLSTLGLMAMPMGGLVKPAFEARGAQIAGKAGFKPLWVPDADFRLDYLPVDAVGDPVEGLSIAYDGFDIQERKADGELSGSDLEKIVAVGAEPLGVGLRVPSNVTYEELMVGDSSAIGAEFVVDPKGEAPTSASMPGKESVIRLLVFSKDGVDVRIKTEGQMAYQGGSGKDERYEYEAPKTFEELVSIGESLAPVD